jgi:hypothetical protein
MRTRFAVALVVFMFLTNMADAGNWVFYDGDKVGREAYLTAVVGDVYWYYDSGNTSHRYVAWNLDVHQTSTKYGPRCLGLQLMFATKRIESTTRDVNAGVSWSLTGPEVSVNTGYSETTGRGMTTDGFLWQCPRNGQFQRIVARGQRTFNPNIDGVVSAVAVKACLSNSPNDPYNRWCTDWDVNDFGGR